MSFRIRKSGLIHDATAARPDERIAFVCGLYRASSESIFASCQLASAKSAPDSHLGLFRSRDHGLTWQRLPAQLPTSFQDIPGSIAGGELMEVAPDRLILVSTWYDRSDPERPLFDPVTEGLLKSKILKTFSDDDGETWSAWEEIPLHGLTGAAVSGGLLGWPDGSIGVGFESFKHYDEEVGNPHAAWILRSFDRGASFPELSQVASDPAGMISYWDQRLCATTEPGEYLGLFWTHDRNVKADLTVHGKLGRCGESIATNLPRPTGIEGQISGVTILADRSAIACVVNRNDPATISLWHSLDGGHTWPSESELTIYNHTEMAKLSQGASDIDFAQYWEDMGRWTFGHPAVLALSPGETLVTYYAGAPGVLNMHWAIISHPQ